jgi:ubiquinone/menaquinone biosynthesis C-methylase UbiE
MTPISDSDPVNAPIPPGWSTQAAAAGWHQWKATLAQYADPPTEIMFDLAGVHTGDHVLDVAAGSGGQTILAARRVGPTGFVLATDVSPQMLAFAETEVQNAGLTNVETQVMDATKFDLTEESFDAVICRGGLEFFPGPEKVLVSMRQVVKPGKKVGVVVFSAPDRCPHVAIPAAIIRERAQAAPPPPGTPGPLPGLFSLAKPGLLQALYERAGFRDVQVVPVTTHLHLSSAAECVRFTQAVGGAVQHMLAHLSDTERQELWKAVEQALRPYEGPSGFEAPCEFLVGVGTK